LEDAFTRLYGAAITVGVLIPLYFQQMKGSNQKMRKTFELFDDYELE